MRIFSYDRTSVWKKQKVSNEAQWSLIRHYALKKHGIEPKRFTDVGRSGNSAFRPGLDALKEAMQQSNEDGIVYVWKYDRCFRNVKEALVFLDFCKEYHIQLCSISEPLPEKVGEQSATQTLFVQLLFTMSELQRTTTIENVRNGLAFKKSQKRPLSSNTPFGYKWVNGQIVQVEKEAAIVRRIFDLYGTGTFGYKKLANHLTKEGACFTKQVAFKEHHIRAILVNPMYHGQIKGGIFGSYEGDFLPIVSKETFDQAKRIREQRQQKKRQDRMYLLRQKLRCPYCERSLSPKKIIGKKKKRMYFYYHCTDRSCRGVFLPAKRIEQKVCELLRQFLHEEPLYRALKEELKMAWKKVERAEEKQKEFLEKRKRQLFEDYEADELSNEELKLNLSEVINEENLLEKRRTSQQFEKQVAHLLSLKEQPIREIICHQIKEIHLNKEKEIVGIYLNGYEENILKERRK